MDSLKKLVIWIPHELKEINLTKRINACDLHLKPHEFDPFLKRIIIGDEKFNAAVKEKRPKLVTRKDVIFHHNNATLHTSLAIRQKLLWLGWEVMLHSPYSPDLALSDYYLYRSLQNSLDRKTFNDDEVVKSHLHSEKRFY